MDAVILSLPVLAGLIGLALLFDFMNGMHDAANSIATIVSTRVLRPQWAVAWAAFFNFIAFLFFGLAVAATLGRGIVAADVIDPAVIFGALMGAIAWNVITWRLGIPSSSSHALIGGLIGAALTKAGFSVIVWQGLGPTLIAIVASPLIGAVLAVALIVLFSWVFRRWSPFAVDRTFRILQFVSASFYSLNHGGNDAQKTMGIIAVLLFTQGHLGDTFYVPFWVVIAAHTAMGLGTLAGGLGHPLLLLDADQAHGGLDQVAHQALDVSPVVADLGVFRRLDLDEGRTHQPGQPPGDLGLAHAGRADQEDVLGRHLPAQLLRELPAPPAVPQGDGHRALGVGLPDDVAVQLGHDLPGGQVAHGSSSTVRWPLV